MEIRSFKPEDLLNLELQEKQFDDKWLQNAEYAKRLNDEKYAYTAIKGDKIMACAGLLTIYPHRAYLWSFVAKDCGKYMLRLYRFIARLLADAEEYTRIETTVRRDFHEAHKGMSILGFQPEGVMIKGGYDASDQILYARIK